VWTIKTHDYYPALGRHKFDIPWQEVRIDLTLTPEIPPGSAPAGGDNITDEGLGAPPV
jgi:hypothetical protein